MFAAVNEQPATDRDYGDGPVLDRVSFSSTGKNDQPVFDERALNGQDLVNIVVGEDITEPEVLSVSLQPILVHRIRTSRKLGRDRPLHLDRRWRQAFILFRLRRKVSALTGAVEPRADCASAWDETALRPRVATPMSALRGSDCSIETVA